ncbi:MAG: hypothetical protein AAFS10_11930 [Myxococcota bacterium]
MSLNIRIVRRPSRIPSLSMASALAWPSDVAYHDWALRLRRYKRLGMKPTSLQIAAFSRSAAARR